MRRLQIGNDNFCEVLAQLRGPEAVAEWKQLQVDMRPLAQASALMPPAAFRADVGVLVTALARYFPSLLQSGGNALKLTGPFSNVGGWRADSLERCMPCTTALCSFTRGGGPGAAAVASHRLLLLPYNL